MADINIAGGFQPTTTNTPLDSRTVVELESDIQNIKLPYVGMFVYVKSNNTMYVVTGLKPASIGPNDVDDMVVDTYDFVWQSPDDVYIVQPDWNQSDPNAVDFIKNKPDVGMPDNVDYIVEHGEGTGEAGGVLAWWWYDKYRSGKVVQGGKTAVQTKAGYYTINLPVEMNSADYVISMAYDGESGAMTGGGTNDSVTASNITSTGFNTYLRVTSNVKYKFWRVEGKAAE